MGMAGKSIILKSELDKKKILLLYDYFDPGYLAGGPTISCANLVRNLGESWDFYILTKNQDLDGSLLDVKADIWQSYGTSARVMYADKCWSASGVLKAIRAFNPDFVYINGIYSSVAVLVPLILARLGLLKGKVVIAPRGMLQSGALSVKPNKKRAYLFLFRMLLSVRCCWHATTLLEAKELKAVIPAIPETQVFLAGNIPRTNFDHKEHFDLNGSLRLLTIALISPMKNIHSVLEALGHVSSNIRYDIYGPIKDDAYWRMCVAKIKKLPANINVTYHGPLPPEQTEAKLAESHFYVQPSKSENFGHSIFEAMMVGLPVITSFTTPWTLLKQKDAGWNVTGVQAIMKAIESATEVTPARYTIMSRNARGVALDYLAKQNFDDQYRQLFSSL
jgi:glycosyltransferase involved in cell wall biosynthesis